MCGIAGWIGRAQPTEDTLARALDALRHRGPDGRGVKCWPEAGIAHTRLSIIDLGPTGLQPMSDERGTVWAIVNGELYDHHTHRERLVSRGHVFKGHSDSEIVPHLYEEDGAALFGAIRGMFAIALYDAARKTLFLARDRFGIKPLFYAATKGRLVFASEINALKPFPGIDLRPDRQAISDFAALGYIPAPATFHAGIRALEPGQVLEARLDGDEIAWKVARFHSWTVAPDPSWTLAKATDRADQLLGKAVRSQLESDVPLGALLSGGIDSSLISAAAQRESAEGINTFNVRFADGAYDETWAAQAVATHVGSHHQTLEMQSVPGSWDRITQLLIHAGQPFADTSMFAVNAISAMMRRCVTVALSGDGGDEAFGGYESYRRIEKIAGWQRLPRPLRSLGSAGAAALARTGRLVPSSMPARIRELSEADDTAILETLQSWIRPEEHGRLFRNGDLEPVRRLFEPQWDYRMPARASRLERLSARNTEINVRLRMANDYLFKVDIASMKESLEVRVPMLDEDLFDFGLTLPHALRVDGGMCKAVLRAVAQRRLPQSVAEKPKQGFAVPVDTWVGADFKAKLRERLLDPSCGLPEHFRPEVYGPMVHAFCEGREMSGVSRAGLYQRVIMLLAVELALSGGRA